MSRDSRRVGDIHHFGERSIYRFDGQLRLDGYTFLGEGEKGNRLTFISLNQELIYMCGKEVKLWYYGIELRRN
jgi:hypothetical protein